ncbi:Dak1 domain-containing protein [Elsinoe ampelina]|uniref:Dak1 domain-containing protein n=1 Tax=Elsinoe ampelina TaxID=302913 RepID=A0A6A6G6L2_9PEZI|nr:Dak1 domain-containing protein [Elsinoe ampelina]
MSSKHFFSDTPGVVSIGLESVVYRNPHLGLDSTNKVVYNKSYDRSKVVLISGGGAGHEPCWSGYVGEGMLAASVSGEIFASPSAKQISAAIERVPSDVAVILCITNYTGDNLHFGLAKEKAVGLGHTVGMLRLAEDTGLGRKQTENTGRRGLAGNLFILKIVGQAAAENYSLDQCMKIGNSINDNCGTIGSSLDYCHLPGRPHHQQLPPDTYSVAQGIHNEPGLKELSPIPPPEELVSSLLKYLLDSNDTDRAYVKYNPNDECVLLINNLGGMSIFELEALSTITIRTLSKEWSIRPTRLYVSTFETSLNAPGWSISLLNLTGLSASTSLPVSTLLSFLDAETTAPAWPRNGYKNTSPSASTTDKPPTTSSSLGGPGPSVPASPLASALRAASNATIAAEPDITKWDTIVGDGDCGESTNAICHSILSLLDRGICTPKEAGETIPLFPVLDAISDAVEDVGGTLGAILAIYAAGFTSSLRRAFASAGTETVLGEKDISRAAEQALENLKGYTMAREGGRTVMDALIPFAARFSETGSAAEAVKAAEEGARRTEGMVGKFGRSSYVGEERGKGTPMDPGAWAGAVFLKGLVEGWNA